MRKGGSKAYLQVRSFNSQHTLHNIYVLCLSNDFWLFVKKPVLWLCKENFNVKNIHLSLIWIVLRRPCNEQFYVTFEQVRVAEGFVCNS